MGAKVVRKLIVVEGGDDKTFVQKLLNKNDVDFLLLEGNQSKLKEKATQAKLVAKVDHGYKFCFVLDSDVNNESEIRKSLKQIPDFSEAETKIFLIPTNLENLILSSLNNENKTKMNDFFITLNESLYSDDDVEWQHENKKKLAVYLCSVKDKPFCATPNAVQSNKKYCPDYIDLNSEVFSDLKKFLKEFAE